MNLSLLARLIGAAVPLTTALVVANAPAASAEEDAIWVTGNFTETMGSSTAPGDELLEYRPGPGQDLMHRLVRDSGNHQFQTVNLVPQVDAWYSPLVGDFNGDGLDDIFWNASGTTPDYLWTATGGGSFSTTHQVQLNGLQYTVSGDFTNDGTDDILYHGPGAAVDGIFDFTSSASSAALSPPTHHVKIISGSYLPAAGNFMSTPGDEVLFYGATASESIWSFNGSVAHTSHSPTQVTASGFRPIVVNTRNDAYDDIFWYLPGTGTDWLWNFQDGSYTAHEAPSPIAINSSYTATAAGDLLGEGYGDIFLAGPTTTRLLDWYLDEDGVVTVENVDLGAG